MVPGLLRERGGERTTCFIVSLLLLWKCRAAEAAKLEALRSSVQNQSSSSVNGPPSAQLELGLLGCVKTDRYWRLPDKQFCYNNHDTASKAEACNWAYAPATATTIHQCWWDAKRSLCQSRERPLCKSVRENAGRTTARSSPEISYRKSWDDTPDMLWLGKDWFANGVQDWQIANGRLECTSSVPMVAGRTAHLLTQAVPEVNRPFSVEFDIDTVEAGRLAERAQGGILLGIGDAHSDYRQSALVQMVPGPGGGMLVALGADGALSVRRFTEQWGPSTLWHACEPKGNGYDFSLLPEAVPCVGSARMAHGAPVRVRVSYMPHAGDNAAGSFLVTAKGHGSSDVSKCAGSLARSHVAGGLSLFSAYGPEGSEKGFAFGGLELAGTVALPERAFGPVLGVLYTQGTFGARRSGLEGRDVRELRMTVQLPVLGAGHRLDLQLAIDGSPPLRGTFHGEDGSWTSRFVLRESATAARPRGERRYRLLLDGSEVYSGVLRRERRPDETTTVGSLSCNKNSYGNVQWNRNGMWFPFNNVSNAVAVHDPDLLFFSGDQVYNGDITPADWRSEDHSLLDFHYKWQRFLWSFGHLTKDRPTITIPDDHDLWQGNIWGEGGHSNVRTQVQTKTLDDVAGFMLSNFFINAVQATMVSHLPPTRVTPRIGNEGINTYTTTFRYGGLDIMVLADRLWKTGPFSDATVKHLLGPEQEALLARWAQKSFPDAWTKVVMSQTPMGSMFTGYKEIPHFGEYLGHQNSSVSKDSNGYPPEARRRAVQLLATAGALHLTGDQHLGLVAQYGADQFEDGTMVFSAPAVASAYARYWMPGRSSGGAWPGGKRYMGHFEDGFGNKFTMLAVSNPVKHDPKRIGTPADLTEKSPGYGIVRFHPTEGGERKTGIISLENWPTWANPCDLSHMYLDWPIILNAQARPISRERKLPMQIYGAHKGPCLLRLRDPNVTEEFYRNFYVGKA